MYQRRRHQFYIYWIYNVWKGEVCRVYAVDSAIKGKHVETLMFIVLQVI